MYKLCADAETKMLVTNDIAKFGSMLVLANILSSQAYRVIPEATKTPMLDRTWAESSVHVLVGFAIYDVVVRKLVSSPFQNPTLTRLFNLWLKFGTMLVVMRLLSGQSLDDKKWQTVALYTLVGFSVYEVAIRPFVVRKFGNTRDRENLDDVLMFGTMFVVSEYLASRAGKTDAFNKQWMIDSGSVLAGFTLYNYGVRNLINT